jgi:hypothetical protein
MFVKHPLKPFKKYIHVSPESEEKKPADPESHHFNEAVAGTASKRSVSFKQLGRLGAGAVYQTVIMRLAMLILNNLFTVLVICTIYVYEKWDIAYLWYRYT